MNPELAAQLAHPASDSARAEALRRDLRERRDTLMILGDMNHEEMARFAIRLRDLQDDCRADGDGDLTLILRLAQQAFNAHLNTLTNVARRMKEDHDAKAV